MGEVIDFPSRRAPRRGTPILFSCQTLTCRVMVFEGKAGSLTAVKGKAMSICPACNRTATRNVGDTSST